MATPFRKSSVSSLDLAQSCRLQISVPTSASGQSRTVAKYVRITTIATIAATTCSTRYRAVEELAAHPNRVARSTGQT